mgnify:CR=1 FL=1
MSTTNIPPYSAASTSAVFTCCLCSTVTPEGEVEAGPLYTHTRFCLRCLHSVCGAHLLPCGFCQACCVEYHGRRDDENHHGR